MSRVSKDIAVRVRRLRREAGMTQSRLAEMLGIPRPSLSQIETGERKISIDELAKLSDIFNCPIEDLLGSGEEPIVVLGRKTKERRRKSRLRINVPQRNVRKFKEVLLYILNRVGSKPNIGETVIYKLLYFIDFDYYEKYEEQLIGATYVRNNYGPTPREFKKIVGEMIKDKEVERVESDYFSFPQRKYLPVRKPDLSDLKANEIEVIDDVLNRLSDMNAAQISAYSHNDVPWLTTERNQVIKYEAVFYRAAPYSVREYSE
ncbi:MAG: repressor protein [Latescibacteria bacterium DG_63]|nr:MAG: repressor protein [Latescibacteria bacterium DG_63]